MVSFFRFDTSKMAVCSLLLLPQLMRVCSGFSVCPLASRTPCSIHDRRQISLSHRSLVSRIDPLDQNNKFPRRTFLFGNRSDDSSPEVHKPTGKVASSWKNFKNGALVVHENFLNEFWFSWSRALLAAVAFSFVTLVPYKFLSPSLGVGILRVFAKLMLGINQIMISVGVAVLVVVGYIVWWLPLFLFVAVPLRLIGCLPAEWPVKAFLKRTVGKHLMHIAAWSFLKLKILQKRALMADAENHTMLSRAMSSDPSAFLSQLVVLSPIIEEIVFRRFLLVSLKRLWDKSDRKGEDNGAEEEADSISVVQTTGYSSWAITSSLLFSLIHLSNWLAPLRRLDLAAGGNFFVAWFYMANALAQCVGTFVISLRLFTPTFEKWGLAASVGAHSMWNFCAMTASIGIPLRLMFRGMKRVRNRSKVTE